MSALLRVISEKSGNQLGTIARADDGGVALEGLGQAIFEQVKEGKGWDDSQTFQALLDGWSNGYVTVRTPEPVAASDA